MIAIGNLDWTGETVDIYVQLTIWLKSRMGSSARHRGVSAPQVLNRQQFLDLAEAANEMGYSPPTGKSRLHTLWLFLSGCMNHHRHLNVS
jgi:hypothetical protein